MFGLIYLNIHNLAAYLGNDYVGIESIILFMGMGTLVDLGTGANSQIIATSNYWKVDFITTVIYTLIALPLNYILIDHFGLMGAAYSFLISRTVFNAMRFGFLWYKFGLQPYSAKNFLAILIALVTTAITYFIPTMPSIIIDAAIRSLVFLALFLPAVYFANISEEINGMIRNVIRRLGFRI
jgi:O-antigen/teichoic acid export membrane protein